MKVQTNGRLMLRGFFRGRKIPFLVVKSMQIECKPTCLVKITYNRQIMFMLRFRNNDDLMKFVEEGPWVVEGQ